MFEILKSFFKTKNTEKEEPSTNNLDKEYTFNFKELPENFRTDIFYPMYMLPPRNPNDSFSKLVIVYDGEDPAFFNLGYYNYEIDKWEIFDDEPMHLKCWCFAPNPSKYWNRENFVTVLCN